MKRRSFLATCAAALGGLFGCKAGGDKPPIERLHVDCDCNMRVCWTYTHKGFCSQMYGGHSDTRVECEAQSYEDARHKDTMWRVVAYHGHRRIVATTMAAVTIDGMKREVECLVGLSGV